MYRFHVKTIETTQKYEGDQIRMNSIDLTSKRSKMLSYVANHSKQRRTTKVIKLQWICIDLTSKRSKMLSYVANHSKQRRTTKVIKLQWIVSNSCQKHQKNAKIQTRSNKDEFASIWRQNDQNVELRRKPFKTMQNNKSNQITINCIDFMSKTSKERKTTNAIK